ncbi:MAG: DUF3014 domain-containing protein [Halieaceae bacterium]
MQNEHDQPENEQPDNDALMIDPEDRLMETPQQSGLNPMLILGAIALIGIIIVVFLFSGNEPEPAAPEPAPVVVAPEPEPEEPAPAADIPEPEPEPQQEPEVAEVPPEPPLALENSDEPVREELSQASSSELFTDPLANADLLQRGTGLIDGLSRGLVLNKVLPVAAPKGSFKTVNVDELEYIDPTSYARYDGHAQAIADLNTDKLVATFHTFRPLLEQSYAGLGYKPDDFDNALIRALDRVIATPELQGDVAVKKKEAIYVFADPALEQLSPLQKQLLRMGPENLAMVKAQARALRSALLGN